jgi:uncharacterized protein YutE (UPF0331/DUF86 family)
MSDEELKYLQELLAKLSRATETLRYSYNLCSRIGIKPAYDEDERDRFESLTSKFARLSDLIIKQSIKIIDILDLEEAPETVRDAINRAEKKGIIASAATFIEIRKLRNRISHEYAESDADIDGIYVAVLNHVAELFDCVERIISYTDKFKPEGRG